MKIPYIEERKELLRLHEERDAIYDEEQTALQPLRDSLIAVRAKAQKEYEAAGGVPLDLAKMRAQDAAGAEKNRRLSEERMDKEEPARQALQAAAAVFEERREKVRDKIKAAEEALGSELAENFWTEEGGRAFCAITGLPILNSDETVAVIKAALPAR